VLAAKAVTAAVTLVADKLVAFTSFFLVQAVLSGHHLGVSLSRPASRPCWPAASSCSSWPCWAWRWGAIVRHTAGGIAALVELIFLPATGGLLPACGVAGSDGSPSSRPRTR
jgi:ABC-2 type transport system permease protein